MMNLIRPALVAIFLVSWGAAPMQAWSQPYPHKPISLVVPYATAGAADLAARLLSSAAAKHLGQPLIVVNRVGANGVIGSQFVLNAEKDGYTLLAARVGSQAVGPALDPTLPYTWNSYSMLGMLEIDPYVCVVNSKSPVQSLQDLVTSLRKRPGELNFATSGTTDTSVVFPVKIFLNAGLRTDIATPIVYKGGGETLNAVLSGQVDFACSPLAPYAGAIKAGRLRGLVVSTRARVPEAPDTPTANEVGMPNLETLSGWTALYGPPG